MQNKMINETIRIISQALRDEVSLNIISKSEAKEELELYVKNINLEDDRQ